jgi:hypothetical protein
MDLKTGIRSKTSVTILVHCVDTPGYHTQWQQYRVNVAVTALALFRVSASVGS